MSNIFTRNSHNDFRWENLGDIKEGRTLLGESMPVKVYRLLEYTMNAVLTKELGEYKANEIFIKSGKLAGFELAKNALDLSQPPEGFIADLQRVLKEMKIGILRMESVDWDAGTFTLTIGEDLDCSGLPVTDETVCNYDEGFLAGILEAYTGKPFSVKEVDCWASGARVCRFRGKIKNDA